MRVEVGWRGPKFTVAMLDTSNDPRRTNIPASEFIEGLKAGGGKDPQTLKRYKAMINRIQQHADQGPLTNKEQCRSIGDDMYELKTRLGDRIYFFYDRQIRGLTVITNGSLKADFKRQERVAKDLKGQWEEWQRTHPHQA